MTSRRATVACLGLLLVTVAAGCDGDAGVGTGFWSLQQARLEAAVERWNESGPASYAFDYRQGCFCPPDVVTPVRITVESGRITDIVYLEDVGIAEGDTVRAGDPVTEFARGTFGTVDDLLADVARAIERRPVEFEVEYSAEYGYPIHRRTVQCRCPDAGFVEEILAFEPLGP